MRDSITLRPIRNGDEDFLFSLFRSVRAQDLGFVDLPGEQKTALLRMQFDAQQLQYRERFPRGNFDLILEADKPVGIIYSSPGGELVVELIRQAQDEQQALTAHVRKDNPAWRLWQRLGFEAVSDDGAYLQIRVPFDGS